MDGNLTKEWVEYPFLAMPANAKAIGNAQCELNLRLEFCDVLVSRKGCHEFVCLLVMCKMFLQGCHNG